MNFHAMSRKWLLRIAAATVTATAMPASATMCGTQNYPFPFTDVGGVSDTFCRGILEAFVIGITRGTTATTFSPSDGVPRLQMTTFLQRTLDQGLKRSNRKAALEQWWVPRTMSAMQAIAVGGSPRYCAADGEHVWVSTGDGNTIVQVQASTGKVLATWTGAPAGRRVLVAAGKVFVAQRTQPGTLSFADPTQPAGAVVAAATLGNDAVGLAFDGTKLWSANASGTVSIITLQAATPYPVTTVSPGFGSLIGALYDGANVWVTDSTNGLLHKLNAAGAIVQSVTVGGNSNAPVFDGTNIWVPNAFDDSVTIVQPGNGSVVATIAADATNLLSYPTAAAFDGERVLVTNQNNESVTLFKAADLSLIANIPIGVGSGPFGVCSDGVNFWVTLANTGMLLRI